MTQTIRSLGPVAALLVLAGLLAGQIRAQMGIWARERLERRADRRALRAGVDRLREWADV